MANIIQQLIDYVINIYQLIILTWTSMALSAITSSYPLPSFIDHPQLDKTVKHLHYLFGLTYLLRQFLHCELFIHTK